MGQNVHRAIVVTGIGKELDAAHAEAVALDLPVSPIITGKVTMFRSFLVAPDGSKEGWDTSNAMNEARAALLVHLRGAPLRWVFVEYGEVDAPGIVETDPD